MQPTVTQSNIHRTFHQILIRIIWFFWKDVLWANPPVLIFPIDTDHHLKFLLPFDIRFTFHFKKFHKIPWTRVWFLSTDSAIGDTKPLNNASKHYWTKWYINILNVSHPIPSIIESYKLKSIEFLLYIILSIPKLYLHLQIVLWIWTLH